MPIPFTAEQFLNVFRNYNEAVWPTQIVLNLLAVVIIIVPFTGVRTSGKIIASILAALWAWMGIAYHILHFSIINKAAYLFGVFFILQAVLFLFAGFHRPAITFRFQRNAQGFAGAILVLYALLIYPLLGHALGHHYPGSPTFGLPCPTVIFTFGLLLWMAPKPRWWLMVIPVLWALIGTTAVWQFGIVEDLGLAVAAVVSVVLLIRTHENTRRSRRDAQGTGI